MNDTPFLSHALPALLFGFVFYYPFFMAYVWMAGGLAHAWVFEQRRDVAIRFQPSANQRDPRLR
mgnify:CR=1 FL=1